MPDCTEDTSYAGSSKSEFDQRAIGVVGHLLVAGIWLECQFKEAPKRLMSLLDAPDWQRPPARLLRT
ncbi:MAG: hypothetical protein JWO62_1874, partial [Acidimicrobiaceae bacterium]|nr:hypothetical protein [Acidimicrobiaceae bacterium]